MLNSRENREHKKRALRRTVATYARIFAMPWRCHRPPTRRITAIFASEKANRDGRGLFCAQARVQFPDAFQELFVKQARCVLAVNVKNMMGGADRALVGLGVSLG